MDIKKVAQDAAVLFGSAESEKPYPDPFLRAYLAGYFEGVAAGRISQGDAQVAEFLLNGKNYSPSETQMALLKAIFSSGMCNQGQPLQGIGRGAGGRNFR